MARGRLIKAVFGEDHDRLDALFALFQESTRSDLPKAREIFQEFQRGLRRHIAWEEDLLFPLWEKKTGMTAGGPTQVMRLEHGGIVAHLEAIHRQLQDGLGSDAEQRALLALLGSHNLKEERVLYPAIDQMTSEDDRDVVYRAMEERPEERV